MDSFELNKIMGALLGTCLVLLVTSFAAQRDLHAHEAGKAGLRDRREGRRRHGGGCQGSRRAGRADREAAADRLRREGRCRRQEVRAPATPSRRAAPTASARTSTASSDETKGAEARLQLLGRHEGQGRQLDLSTTSTSSSPTRRPSFPAPRWALPASTKDSERADVIAYLRAVCRTSPAAAADGGEVKFRQSCMDFEYDGQALPGRLLMWIAVVIGAFRRTALGSRAEYHEEKAT